MTNENTSIIAFSTTKKMYRSSLLTRYKRDVHTQTEDLVAIESVLQIKLSHGKGSQRKNEAYAILLRTPGKDEDLIRGMLYAEGIIQKAGHIMSLREESGSIEEAHTKILHVELSPELQIDSDTIRRNTMSNSSCGLCGKESLEMMDNCIYPIMIPNGPFVHYKFLLKLKGVLTQHQSLFSITGGSHASACLRATGEILALCEDVGRHNAMDKVLGSLLKASLLDTIDQYIGVVSGRVSYELVHKALLARMCILVSLGAPSSLSIDLAKENGLTLVGFLKEDSFNIYTHHERILLE